MKRRAFLGLVLVSIAAVAPPSRAERVGEGSRSSSHARIVNGKKLPLGDLPFVAFNGCTGTIITKNEVLTASHCKQAIRSTRVGRTGRGRVRVTKFFDIADEGTVSDEWAKDVLILRISPPTAIRPVPIITSRELEPGEPVVVAGFGSAALRGSSFGTLRWGRTVLWKVEPMLLWTKFRPDDAHPCYGDSGSALWGYYSTGSGRRALGVLGTVNHTPAPLAEQCSPGDSVYYPNLRHAAMRAFLEKYAKGVVFR